MTAHTRILHMLAAVALALPCAAQDPSAAARPSPQGARDTPVREGKKRESARASELMGMEIKTLEGEKLGHVDDLAVVLASGTVVQAIVAFGGIRGVEDKLTALPPRFLQLDEENKLLRLKTDTAKLQTAPRFEPARWEEAVKHEQMAAVYRHYGTEPPGKTNGNAAAHAVERGSKLIGAPVVNSQDQKVGKVEDFLVDLEESRIAAVVVSSGEFLGVSGELSAVPPSVLNYNAQHDTLVLNATKAALAEAPHFQPNQWPDLTDRNHSGRMHAAFGLKRPAEVRADNTRKNQRDRDGKNLTPLDQGSSEEDVRITAEIRKAVIGRDDLSVSARNVKIITLNGKVTLRGAVANEQEKRAIEDIAKGITRAGMVDSQLELK